MKRQNIELTRGSLDAVRRRDRAAARGFLDPGIVWQGIVPDLICHGYLSDSPATHEGGVTS